MESTIVLLMIGLGAVTPATQPDSIDACGWFEEYPDSCVYFHAFIHGNCVHFGAGLSTIPDSLLDYALYRVRADLIFREDWCGSFYELVLQDPVMSSCEPVDLGCGVLYYDEVDHCNTWASSLYGALLIDSFQGYADRDTVRAVGVIDLCMPNTCFMAAIRDFMLYPCQESPPALRQDTWGAVKALFK